MLKVNPVTYPVLFGAEVPSTHRVSEIWMIWLTFATVSFEDIVFTSWDKQGRQCVAYFIRGASRLNQMMNMSVPNVAHDSIRKFLFVVPSS